MEKLRTSIAILILGAQLVLIVYSRTMVARYFCWAPFDMQTDYKVEVTLHGRKLNPQEIRQRYRRPATGTDNRSIQNLIDVFEGYEERYAGADKAVVVLHYQINGKKEQEWRYPHNP